ncbi:MAG: translation elongation factor Ts [Eubacteriales bacterium]|nr:translation elongation factor Ts [Eubacteriales bacterium]
MITTELIKNLRERTGAGMMDCKRALQETDGDLDKASDYLREKGLAAAAKKASRVAAEGLVGMALADDGTAAAMAEINSETDFVAKNVEFVDFVNGVSAAALAGDYADLDAFGKAPLGDSTIADSLVALIGRIGENMKVRRFVRLSNPGCVYCGYLHGNGRIGVIVELETEASQAEVNDMGRAVAMQVASMNPTFVSDADVSAEWLENEQHILLQQALNENAELEKPKPQQIVEKMVSGRIKKELKEICLLDQAFVKEADKSVGQMVKEEAGKLGKPVTVRSFVRYEMGEGLQKREDNFVDEVMSAVKK